MKWDDSWGRVPKVGNRSDVEKTSHANHLLNALKLPGNMLDW